MDEIVDELAAFAGDDFCHLTTRGRVSGRPHEIEIWFALDDGTLYLLSGGGERSDWVRNLRTEPSVTAGCAAARAATSANHARACSCPKYVFRLTPTVTGGCTNSAASRASRGFGAESCERAVFVRSSCAVISRIRWSRTRR